MTLGLEGQDEVLLVKSFNHIVTQYLQQQLSKIFGILRDFTNI